MVHNGLNSFEELLGAQEIEQYTGQVDTSDCPEGGCIAKKLGDDAADKDAYAHAYVPRDEDGGIGRTSLMMVSHRNHHVLEGWPQVAIAQSDENGGTIVADGVGAGDKQGVADERDDHAFSCVVRQETFAQRLASLQS